MMRPTSPSTPTGYLAKVQYLPEHQAAHYYPNVTYILNSLGKYLFGWFVQHPPAELIRSLIALYAKTLERKRPSRTAPRPKGRLHPKPRRQYK